MADGQRMFVLMFTFDADTMTEARNVERMCAGLCAPAPVSLVGVYEAQQTAPEPVAVRSGATDQADTPTTHRASTVRL